MNEKTEVYNLNVLGYHTYIVGNELIIVHNACTNKLYDVSEYKMANRGHSGRYQPKNVLEQMALNDAKSFPTNAQRINIKLNDSRWPSSEGWSKMQKVYYGIIDGKKQRLQFIM